VDARVPRENEQASENTCNTFLLEIKLKHIHGKLGRTLYIIGEIIMVIIDD
jgi:hypothetical protein